MHRQKQCPLFCSGTSAKNNNTMRYIRTILILALSVIATERVNAQSRSRSSISAGTGVIINHSYVENQYNESTVGPVLTIGYDFHFTEKLSVSAWGSAGQILLSGQTYARDPSLPGLIKIQFSEGIVANSERVSFGSAIVFSPMTWLSLGVGPYCEFVKSAWQGDGQMNISGKDPETGEEITKEIVLIPDYYDRKLFRYGLALPISIQCYKNDRFALSCCYQACFYRHSQGRFRPGTNVATISVTIYL